MAKSTCLQAFQVNLHEIEGIPFRRYGSLLQSELEWFESQSDSRIKSIKAILELARDIAVNEGITEDEALVRVQNIEDDDNKALALKYADRFDAIKSSAYTDIHFQRDVAVMMLNSRVPKKWLKETGLQGFQEAFDIELNPDNPLFTVEDVKRLPTVLINAISDFTANERVGWEDSAETTGLQEGEELSLGKSLIG